MHTVTMSRQLPSPVALRSFEAAARLLSFTRAARELFVTQSAVSHQVRALEEDLGIRLFVRMTRQLRLTQAGEALLSVLRDSFDRIEDCVDDLKSASGARPLRVSLTSYFAARWFTRRLSRFSALHPQVEIHLQLSNEDVDVRRADVDVAILWGQGDWGNAEATHLMALRVIAVCSPALLKGLPELRDPGDLDHLPLLHESGRGLWAHYFQALGHDVARTGRNVVMDDANVLHQACVEGQGVALGAEALLADELERGSLVRLFDQSVEFGGYYIVRPPGVRLSANVKAFHQWLLDEAKSRSAN